VPRHLRRLIAHAAHGEVDPLVRRELGPLALVLLQVEGSDLDRGQLVDPKRVLALAFLVIGEAHLDLGPDAACQQALIVADVVRRDVDEFVAYLRKPEERPDPLDLIVKHVTALLDGVSTAFGFAKQFGPRRLHDRVGHERPVP
jgi:hypothetical protein